MRSLTTIKLIRRTIFVLMFGVLLTCTPSKEFFLKQNKSAGYDRINIRVLLKTSDGRVLISSKSRMKMTDIKTGAVMYDDKGKDIYFEPDQIAPLVLGQVIAEQRFTV